MSDSLSEDFIPHSALDLSTANAVAFKNVVNEFNQWAKTQPLSPLTLANGWYDITPVLGEGFLKRSRQNRPADFATTSNYAATMADDGWKKTGQPIIFNTEGLLDDGQHRLWAGYLSGRTFPSYIVFDSPAGIDDKFAFIDQGRGRNAAETLITAGFNGLSSQIAATVDLAVKYETGRLNFRARRQHSIARMTKHEILKYVRNHPELSQSAHLLYGTYRAAANLIGAPKVAILMTWLIIEKWDAEVLDSFMRNLARPDLPRDNPIKALQVKLEDNETADSKITTPELLGFLIKTFNHWKQSRKFSRAGLTISTDEAFPEVLEPGDLPPAEAAAE